MLLLGLDIGTSSVKATVVDAGSRAIIASAQYPEQEAAIMVPQPGWAEQDPEQWWAHAQQAILKCNARGAYKPADIVAIGIAYQMHGLVLTNKQQQVLRPAIIWCDSRAVEIGNTAFAVIGEEKCLGSLLNSPGNFTASKLGWVKTQEPEVYDNIDKAMLPGDYISMRLSGELTTTPAALSEGILWDFQTNSVSADILQYFDFSEALFPAISPVFAAHGYLSEAIARELSLKPGIPISYKSGDQPNNAFSLNVLQPGEVAATAGTSGVIYAVSDQLTYDRDSRINSFAHVNHDLQNNSTRVGVLLNINGCGIMNSWVKNRFGQSYSYPQINELAAKVPPGSNGLLAFPFGNGAERMLGNRIPGAAFDNIDFNRHDTAHLFRATQEGIAFAFRYGLDIMRENGINPTVIRAGKANLFLSDVFTRVFATLNQAAVEFYEGDGSFGAAIGAGIGAGIYKDANDAMSARSPLGTVEPGGIAVYDEIYETWKHSLERRLQPE